MNSGSFPDDFNMKSRIYANSKSDCQFIAQNIQEQKLTIQESSSELPSGFNTGSFNDPQIAEVAQGKENMPKIQTNRHRKKKSIQEKGHSQLSSLKDKPENNDDDNDQNGSWTSQYESLNNLLEPQTDYCKDQGGLDWEVCYMDDKEEHCAAVEFVKGGAADDNLYQDKIRLASNQLFNIARKSMKKAKVLKSEKPLKDSKANNVNLNDTDELYFEEYKIIQILGRGSHGIVLRVRHRLGYILAIKLYDKARPNTERMFQQEITPLLLLGAHKIIETPEFYGIVMRSGVGSLKDFKNFVRARQVKLTDKQIIETFLRLLDQLDNIFSKGFAHRDIKPGNIILVDKTLSPEIIDYSCAICFNTLEKLSGCAGTKGYIAPDIYNQRKHKRLTKEELIYGDIFSLGITLLELAVPEYYPVQNDPDLEKTISKLSDRPVLYELFNELLFPKACQSSKIIQELKEKYNQLYFIEDKSEKYSLSDHALKKYYPKFMEYLKNTVSNDSKIEGIRKELKKTLSLRQPTDANSSFTAAMQELRLMRAMPRDTLISNLKKAGDILKEAGDLEQELLCYEYMVKCHIRQNKPKEASEYVNKCFKMTIDANITCHPLLYSTLANYYFVKKDFQTALRMLSIGLERCDHDHLAKIILLNNYGCLLWKEDQPEYNKSLEKAYDLIEQNYLEIVNSLMFTWPTACVRNTMDSISLQWFKIAAENRYYEGVLSIRGFSLIAIYSNESIIGPVVLNMCASKAYCLINIFQTINKMTLIQQIQSFCSSFIVNREITSTLQGSLETFLKLGEFGGIIENAADEVTDLGPPELTELIQQAQLLKIKDELKTLCSIFEKDELGLSIKELKCKDLLFTMIGLTMIYRDSKLVKPKPKVQILEDKLDFLFQLKDSVELEPWDVCEVSQIENVSKIIPATLQKRTKNCRFQVKLDNSSGHRQYLWSLQSIAINLWPLQDNDVDELAKFIETIRDIKKILLKADNCANLSYDSLICLSNKLSKLDISNLYLDLIMGQEVNGNKVELLGTTLFTLNKQLKGLKIHIGNNFISTNGIKPLERSIQELKCLNNLELRFGGCPNITNALIPSLNKMIQELPSLKDLTIQFNSCGNISTQKVKEFESELKPLFESVKIGVSSTFNY